MRGNDMAIPCQGFTTLLARPFSIFATCIPVAGALQVFVYRTTRIKDRHGIYKPVLGIVGDTEPMIREVMDDDLMVMGEAELLVYVVDVASEVRAA